MVKGTAKIRKHSLSRRRKSAEALHMMPSSCALEAKTPKDLLNNGYSNKPTAPPQGFNVEKFYKAICENKWDLAKPLLDKDPRALTARLTISDQTALHVAALFGHEAIVEELLKLVSQKDLELVDITGRTPLLTATYTGVTQIAKCIVIKNRSILGIPTPDGKLPVSLAFAVGHKEMARYLYQETPLEDLKPDEVRRGPQLLYYCFYSKDLDVAVHLLGKCKELLLAELDENGWTPILGIAAMPSAFPSGSQLLFWKRWIFNCIHIQPATTTDDVHVDIQPQDQSKRVEGLGLLHRLICYTCNFLGMKEIYELKFLHAQAAEILKQVCEKASSSPMTFRVRNIVADALFCAAREGNFEFVFEVIKANPDSILFVQPSSKWHTFFFAVQYRQAKVFSLIHGLPFKYAVASMLDISRNSLLHVAGMLPPPSQLNRIPGAALQMQREVQWFKEVESVVPRAFKVSKNHCGKRPADIFKENHKELRKEGEEWMKGTATSCSVVGALVVTIMFAAAFTIPGGNNQNSGYPIFMENKFFMVFIISDALSLFSSTTSVLIFLGILTSRYLEEDFLNSLPKRLIIGLSSLFISIVTMMIAFSVTIIIMLDHRHSWALLPIILLASVPVTLFVFLHFRLLVQIVYYTWGPSIFNKNVKLWP